MTIESSVTSMFTTTTGLPSLIVIIGVEEPFSDFGDLVSVFVSSSKFALYVLLNSSESAEMLLVVSSDAIVFLAVRETR